MQDLGQDSGQNVSLPLVCPGSYTVIQDGSLYPSSDCFALLLQLTRCLLIANNISRCGHSPKNIDVACAIPTCDEKWSGNKARDYMHTHCRDFHGIRTRIKLDHCPWCDLKLGKVQ